MRDKVANPDRMAAKIAARQYGVLSIGQLRAIGMSSSGVSRRLRAGRLHSIHRGVYAVGHDGLSLQARYLAAVLACGAEAAVSHRSAAVLWGLLRPLDGPIDVSVPSGGGRSRRAGIRVHRRGSMSPGAVTQHRGIPVTTPAVTVKDLRRVVPDAQLRRATRQAEVLGLRLGDDSSDRTRSELERRFLALCSRQGLPEPEVNIRIGVIEVDFLWRDQRLIVETDGYRYHRGRMAFEDDRERDLRLRALGYEVIRLSYRQVTEESERVGTVLRSALSSAS